MEQKQFAEQYVISNRDKFNSDQIFLIKNKLEHLPEDRQIVIQTISLKDPIITLLLSLLLGGFAIDRFYIGDVTLGILKIITVCFVIGFIWVILDWFLTYKKTKKINFEKIMLLA
ncbi:TM2 domain-containing protein [Orbaceae bacterium ESL0721]|nr:TM2 domain-containing protein [Orbaceae bacterium ESL0721]